MSTLTFQPVYGLPTGPVGEVTAEVLDLVVLEEVLLVLVVEEILVLLEVVEVEVLLLEVVVEVLLLEVMVEVFDVALDQVEVTGAERPGANGCRA